MIKTAFIKKILISLIVFFTTNTLIAQESQTLYYMNRIPQARYLNPAFAPDCNIFIGLPTLSSFYFGLGNNRLVLTDIIIDHPVKGTPITVFHPDANIDSDYFSSILKERNYLYDNLSTDILSFGFRVQDWYFSMNVSEKLDMAVNYPKDLVKLLLEDPENYTSLSVDLSSFGFNASLYQEYGFGVSKQISPKLSVGGKLKIIGGHVNSKTNYSKNKLKLQTNMDSLYIEGDATIYTTSPYSAETDEKGNFDKFNTSSFDVNDALDYALSLQNFGLGIDLGATYKPINKLLLSASIIDLGYIKWNEKNVTKLDLKGTHSFRGFDFSEDIADNDDNGGDNQSFSDITDSIKNSFDIAPQHESYKTFLSTKIYIGASYYISPKVDFGFLSRTYFYNQSVSQSFTLSTNVRPIRGVSASLTYSIIDNTFNNLGFGLILGGAPIQFYIMSDNASVALWGHKTNTVNFRFGLNLTFGSYEKKKKSDIPLLESIF
ncbi:MAG: DUF5723 family protein [Bacteroidales bacterium]|nr:DUF5723 family protein [Bacteroidales bacterium]